MESLYERHFQRLQGVNTDFMRSIADDIDWTWRMIAIKGARGVGKTTLLLQYILKNFGLGREALYASMDNIWFSNHTLLGLADMFHKRGGKYLFLDEVHKYPDWVREMKNIYDDYPGLKVVFTGSSLLEILDSRADLSRRVITYEMQGLSFREFLRLHHRMDFKKYSLKDIIIHHEKIAQEIVSKIKPLQYFDDYLRFGYYPFYLENPSAYYNRIEEIINMILEIELPLLRNVAVSHIPRLKRLLHVISSSAPFIPDIKSIAERVGISRVTLLTYLFHLSEARLTFSLYKNAAGVTKLQKPDKLYLENTNLMYVLSSDRIEKGNIRETYFANQLAFQYKLEYSGKGDFLVNGEYTFEIGGAKKGKKQIADIADSWIVSDDIEYGLDRKIPLWIFGFLY